MSEYWFKPKSHGYGASPANWKGWAATVGLRDAARAWIARECGEPAVARGAVIVDQPPD